MTENQVKQVDQIVLRLGEEFDSVLILISEKEGGTSRILSRRSGNYFACLGMAHEFIQMGKAETIAGEISRQTGDC